MANDPSAPSTDHLTPQESFNQGLPKEVLGFMNLVRAKMRDFPELNRLIAGQETSDRMVLLAMAEAVDDFNTTPPLIGAYNFDNFPSMSLLLDGTIINILESVGLLQTRNHLVYSDGGIQVGVSDKVPELFQWLNWFTQKYEATKVKLKQAINLQGALNGSGVPSEYRYVNGLWDYL